LTERNQLWETDGTLANTKKIGSVRQDLFVRNLISDGNAIFVLASGEIDFQFGSVDSTIYAFQFNQPSTFILTDSIKTNDFRGVNNEVVKNGKAWLAQGNILFSLAFASGKFERVPGTVDGGSSRNKFVECNGNLFVYTRIMSAGKSYLCKFDTQTQTLSPVLERSDLGYEAPLCYGNTLVGEAVKGNGSGAFVLYNGVDTFYYSSGQTSFEFRLSGSKLFWIGDGLDGLYGSLWKLDLTTISINEPLPHQLDLAVYPTITSEGRFSLNGKDSATRLMSAQLVNSEGKIVHLQTFPTQGETINFGTKPPGLYFIFLVAVDGRRFIEKVVYE
jgi:hypothetical protein